MAVSKRVRYEVLKRDNYTCRYCRSTENELTVDHVTPVALGGTDLPKNLVAACRDCNAGKASTAPDAPPIAALGDKEIAYERARARVLARATADQSSRAQNHASFQRAWAAWDDEYRHLSAKWRLSLDMWMARGLTMPRIIEAFEIALGKDYLPASSVFTYMAKICWNWVDEIEEAIELELKSTESESETAFDGTRIVELFIDKRAHLIPEMPKLQAV